MSKKNLISNTWIKKINKKDQIRMKMVFSLKINSSPVNNSIKISWSSKAQSH